VVEPTLEYGCQDLGIVQDCRRRYLEPKFSWQTNDLAMAFQFYQLRTSSTNADVSVRLDRVFADIAGGRIAAARTQLNQLTAGK
jgi:hypothetical protein